MNCVVIGKGRAGAARVRTIQEHPHCTLIRHVSGREFQEPKENERSLYFVCTENRKHYETGKMLLEHGHHVAIEFPPCLNQKEWNTLISLAQQKESILHCGLIGLYTQQHKHRKKWICEQRPDNVCVEFSGGLYRWVQEEAALSRVPLLAFGRIAAIWDLFGPLRVTEVTLDKTSHSYTFTLQAKGRLGEDVFLRERRAEGMSRSTAWSMTRSNGELFFPPARTKENLFGVDLERILQRTPSDVNISDVFAFLDHVHAMTYGDRK